MSILFYLNQQNNEKSISDFLTFLLEFTSKSQKKIIVLCESDFDYSFLKSRYEKTEKETIINLYSTEVVKSETKNNVKLKFDHEYLFNIERKRFNNLKSVPQTASKIEKTLNFIITENDVEFCFFIPIGGIFRSIGMVILQELIKHNEMKSYLIFSTPLKGRFAIYDDIYLSNKKFQDNYFSLLSNGLDGEEKDIINQYFDDYLKFKNNWHVPFLLKRRDRKRDKLLIKLIIHKITNLLKWAFVLEKSKSKNSNRPYILFLLSKNNHWFSSFANPELLNRIKMVERIYTCLPKGYDLVLKSHPHVGKDESIEKFARKHINCYNYYDTPTTYELVEGASLVLSAGTTAGVEALIQNKHVIEFGNRPPYFNFDKAPVQKIDDFDQLSKVIENLLNEEPPLDRIYAFFYSLLTNSYSFTDNLNDISIIRDCRYYKKTAKVLIDRMNEDAREIRHTNV